MLEQNQSAGMEIRVGTPGNIVRRRYWCSLAALLAIAASAAAGMILFPDAGFIGPFAWVVMVTVLVIFLECYRASKKKDAVWLVQALENALVLHRVWSGTEKAFFTDITDVSACYANMAYDFDHLGLSVAFVDGTKTATGPIPARGEAVECAAADIRGWIFERTGRETGSAEKERETRLAQKHAVMAKMKWYCAILLPPWFLLLLAAAGVLYLQYQPPSGGMNRESGAEGQRTRRSRVTTPYADNDGREESRPEMSAGEEFAHRLPFGGRGWNTFILSKLAWWIGVLVLVSAPALLACLWECLLIRSGKMHCYTRGRIVLVGPDELEDDYARIIDPTPVSEMRLMTAMHREQ